MKYINNGFLFLAILCIVFYPLFVESLSLRQIQERLKAEGFDPGPIDGIPGPKTKKALQKYQATHGLEAMCKLMGLEMTKHGCESPRTRRAPNVQGADVVGSFTISGGDTGLKDVTGSRRIEEGSLGRFLTATGEAIDSATSVDDMIIVSSSAIYKIEDNEIKLLFNDGTYRTFLFTNTTQVCDREGNSININDLSQTNMVSILWEAKGKDTLKSDSKKSALSIRKGRMRYKIAEPDGRILPKPVLANNSCL